MIPDIILVEAIALVILSVLGAVVVVIVMGPGCRQVANSSEEDTGSPGRFGEQMF